MPKKANPFEEFIWLRIRVLFVLILLGRLIRIVQGIHFYFRNPARTYYLNVRGFCDTQKNRQFSANESIAIRECGISQQMGQLVGRNPVNL